MTPDTREHDWVRAQLAAFCAGLLEETASARVERHVEGCSICREALNLLRSPEASFGRHLPDRVLSRWGTSRVKLRGLQRELVRRHLDSCDECRQILIQLGQDPVLERVPQLEPSSELLARLDGTSPPQVVPIPRRYWLHREFWAGSISGGLAAAAAAMLLVANPALRSGPAPVRPAGPGRGSTNVAPVVPAPAPGQATTRAPLESGLVVEFAPPAVRASLSGAERGIQSATNIPITRETRVLELSADPPDVPDSSTVQVRLTSESGVVLYSATRPVSDLYGGRQLIVRSRSPFAPGRYRLRLQGERDGVTETAEYAFRLFNSLSP